MSEDFGKLLTIRRNLDAERDKEYNKVSKERLLKICQTKMRTIMIGALAAIEEKLKPYWTPEEGEKPANEQVLLQKLYGEIRQEILDKGNTHIRNLEAEFEQYKVEWKRHTVQLPVKGSKDG
jgi:hypothetical protein